MQRHGNLLIHGVLLAWDRRRISGGRFFPPKTPSKNYSAIYQGRETTAGNTSAFAGYVLPILYEHLASPDLPYQAPTQLRDARIFVFYNLNPWNKFNFFP